MVSINENLELQDLRTKLCGFDVDKRYALLDLSDNKIMFMHDIFPPWCQNISILKLNNCNLLTIERYTFQSLTNIEVLNLSNNNLTIIPTELFEHCDRLKTLSLRNNSIDCFQASVFKRIKNLEELDLSFNFLKQITNTTHPTLEVLNLSNNLIVMFYGNIYPKLLVLNMSFNRLEKIVKTTSKNMRSLAEVDFSNNQISAIKSTVFKHATNLRILRLSNNRLIYFTMEIFSAECNLHSLELDGNSITNLHLDPNQALYLRTFNFSGNMNCKFNSFGMFLNLRRLYLSGCTFYLDILPNLFNLCALEHFNFSNNSVHKIPNGYFANLVKLIYLSLENSEAECLSSLTEPLFREDNSLKRLLMSGCGIVSVTPFFKFLINLTYLNLSRNKIFELDPVTFVDLVELKYLYLNMNELTGFQPHTFRTLNNLKTIDLTMNLIVELNRRLFEHSPYVNNLWCDPHVRFYDE